MIAISNGGQNVMITTYPSSDTVFSFIPLKILVRLRIIFPEFLDDILADITIILLDLSCDLQLLFRRYCRHLPALSHEVEHELRDIAASDWDMFDSTSDDVSFRARYNVRDTVAGVNDSTSECTIINLVGGP